MKPTTTLVLDTRRAKANGTYPVKVRLTHNRQQKYYATGVDLLESEWVELNGLRLRKEQKQLKEKLIAFQGKAKAIVDDLKTFSFDVFETRYSQKQSNKGAVNDLYEDNIGKLLKQGRISTAISYEYSLKSLLLYKPNLSFEQINPDFLERYEKWMSSKGKSNTTIGMYLRALRAVYNEAIDKGIVPRELYPFGKRKYSIPSGTGVKKALELENVKEILNYKCPALTTMEYAKDLWLFCYLCNGVNVKDIAKMRYKNLDKDFLRFVRSKTERSTKSKAKVITVPLLPETKNIIKKWGNKDKSPDCYIFPILSEGMDAQKQYKAIQQCTQTINKYMRRIADDLGIDKDVTTYTARHTFSTVLKRSGASVEFIQEALGHTDKSTTEAYLDSFENEAKKKFAERLLKFK